MANVAKLIAAIAALITALTALGGLGLTGYLTLAPNPYQESFIELLRGLAGLSERIEP